MHRSKILSVSLLFAVLFLCSSFDGNKPTRSSIQIGSKAPNIIVKKNKGFGKHKLSKVNKNKVVLVEFWASWCAPCRQQNRTLVEVYSKYKNTKLGKAKGFEIFAVSFDSKKKNWKKAIESDGIGHFNYHGSDMKGWESVYALVYELDALPANVLIDEEGTIIAKDLTTYELESWLQSLERKSNN